MDCLYHRKQQHWQVILCVVINQHQVPVHVSGPRQYDGIIYHDHVSVYNYVLTQTVRSDVLKCSLYPTSAVGMGYLIEHHKGDDLENGKRQFRHVSSRPYKPGSCFVRSSCCCNTTVLVAAAAMTTQLVAVTMSILL